MVMVRLPVGPLAEGPQSEEHIPVDVHSRDLGANLVGHAVNQTEAGCLSEVIGAYRALVALEVGGDQGHRVVPVGVSRLVYDLVWQQGPSDLVSEEVNGEEGDLGIGRPDEPSGIIFELVVFLKLGGNNLVIVLPQEYAGIR